MIILWELLQQGGEGPRYSFFQDRKTHWSFLGSHFSYRAQKNESSSAAPVLCEYWVLGRQTSQDFSTDNVYFSFKHRPRGKRCNWDIRLGPVSHPLHMERCSLHPTEPHHAHVRVMAAPVTEVWLHQGLRGLGNHPQPQEPTFYVSQAVNSGLCIHHALWQNAPGLFLCEPPSLELQLDRGIVSCGRWVTCILSFSKASLFSNSEPRCLALWGGRLGYQGRHHLVPENSFTSSSTGSLGLTPQGQVNVEKRMTYRTPNKCKAYCT